MQNKLFAAIAMIMVIMIGMTGIGAATTEDVTVSIGDGTGDVTIPIIVENVTNLGCCDIWLDFDKDLVSVSVTDGQMDFTTFNALPNDGRVHIVATQIDAIGLDGNVIVANVTLGPVGPCSMGSCGLNIDVINLYFCTNGSEVIPHNVDNGTYTTDVTIGNVDGDGDVTIYDAMYIAMYVLTHEEYPDEYPIACPDTADVDCNPGISTNDARYLANHIVDPGNYEIPCVPPVV